MFQTNVVEKIKTHFVFKIFFLSKIVFFYQMMCKNTVQTGRQVTVESLIWSRKKWYLLAGWLRQEYRHTHTHTHTLIIQSGPKKYIHSLLINIFGINLNEISISGW